MGRQTLLCLVLMPLVFGLTLIAITVRLVRLPVLALPVLISVPFPLTPPVVVLLFPVPVPANKHRASSMEMSAAVLRSRCLRQQDAMLGNGYGQRIP